MAYKLADFVRPAGNHPPGMSDILLIVQRKDIKTFPGVLSTNAQGATVTLDGNIEFEADSGLGFVKCYATKDTIQATMQRIGQKDSRGWSVEIPFFVPAINAPWIEFMNEDPELVVLVKAPDCEKDEWLCLGDLCRALELEGQFESGEASDESGRHGWTNTLKGYLSTPRIYTGTITMASENANQGG